jgi:hypothetical protein
LKIEIENSVLEAFQNAQDVVLKKGTGNRIRTWHVSDFVSPCLRKTFYQKAYPEWSMDDDKRSALWIGTMVHEYSQLSEFHEITMCYDIEEDVALSPQEVRLMGAQYTKNIITGTFDDLMKIGGDYVLVDKKTWNGRGYKKTEPDEGYVNQLNIYRVLLKEALGIDAKYGALLYLDKTSQFAPLPLAFKLDPIGRTKKMLREILDTLTNGNIPNATPNFLCNGNNRQKKIYCPYLDRCNADTAKEEQLGQVKETS